jgi:AmmeMemoRadiSam system protein B
MLWYPELDQPRLRPLEAIPAEYQGEVVVALRDPLGLSAEGLAVPLPVFHLLTQMTGRRTVSQIVREFREQFDVEVPEEKLRHIILQLDDARCLESEHFRRHRQARLDAYRSAVARPMSAGSYPRDPAEFRAMFDSHFTQKGGPGRKPLRGSGPEIRALVAPHIDFQRGGPNYGWAYQALGDGTPPETVVILGTSHAHCRNPFTLTRLPFETPLDPVAVDVDFVDALQAQVSTDLFEEELLHASEHSVEFQVIALRHVFADAPAMRIVPILCGPIHDEAEDGGSPSDGRSEDAIQALTRVIASWPRRVTVIAGADLAHIGPHFGDPEPVSDEHLAEVHRQDQEALRHVAAGDAEGFLRSFDATQNARRVCSVACIHTLLRCLPALGVERGRLLHYMQSTHPSRQLSVTHASLAFP